MSYLANMIDCTFHVKTENTGRVIKKSENYSFHAELDDEGAITGLEFVSEKISFDEDRMFQEIAPYVENGSYIEMEGEDSTRWRWLFKNGKCTQVKALLQLPGLTNNY